MVQNKGVFFKKIPVGAPIPGETMVVEIREFDLDQAPPAGGITTKNLYASFDPYQRGRMRDVSIKSYSPAYPLGTLITNNSIVKVLKSDSPNYQSGDLIHGMIGYEEYSAITAQALAGMRKINNPYNLDPMLFVGALGMPGLTAYSSLYAIGKPKKGETIYVSAAAGAVGQLVGQLAKHEGLKVIGSVGSDEKADFITKELNFDGAYNYKMEKPADALARLAPEGIDIYYENVGGEQLEAAINAMNNFGRIVACGTVSEYNKSDDEKYPIKNLFQIVAKRITFQGFICGDPHMGPAYYKEFSENVSKWLHEGTFKAKMSVTVGIDNAAEGLAGMLEGKNFGKAILKIADL